MDSKKIKYKKNIISALKHTEKLNMMLSRILSYNFYLKSFLKDSETGYIWFKNKSESQIFENTRKIKKMSEDAYEIEKSLKILLENLKEEGERKL